MSREGFNMPITQLDDDEIYFAETLVNEVQDGCLDIEEAGRTFNARVREIRARRRVFGDDRGGKL